MASLLPCYLLLAVLHISGAFGFLDFIHEVVSQRQGWEKPRPKPEWDNEVLQNIRSYYHFDPQRMSRSKFYENMKYHQLHFPAGWAVQKSRDSVQAQSMTRRVPTFTSRSGFRASLPKAMHIENILLDPNTRSEATEKRSYPGLQQSLEVAQQDVTEKEPIEMTEETLDVEENTPVIESTEEIGDFDSVDARKSGKSGKKGTDDIFSTKKTSTTEVVTDSSGLEETTTFSVREDERTSSIYGRISEGISPSNTHFPTTTDTVTKTDSSIHSATDSKRSTVDDRYSEDISPSITNIPSTVTVGETVSSVLSMTDSKHSTTDGSSSNGISLYTTHFPATTVTFSKTVSSIFSTAYSKHSTVDGGSSQRISLSTTHFPASTGTVSPTSSTVDGGSSSRISPSTTHFPATTVTVSLPLTGTEGPTPEHVIGMPRIRTAKIIISSVLLAIGLVAVAVMAVCIFRERRKAVKYDQLKLLP